MEDSLRATIAVILLVTFCFGIYFVFDGDPDLWDKWHVEVLK